jgi:[ribosomal protein S18]-alanine N-acetyltransferase
LSQHSGTARSSTAPFTVALRSYSPADFEKIYAIDQACYEPRIAYSRTELRQYLRFPGAECVVAEASRDNSAPAMIGFCITAHKGSWGYIVTMDVLAEYRRHGVGSMLLLEAERRLVTAGVRQIGLETATDNAPAIAFWQKHGYRRSGLRKNYYPGGRDAYSMAKRL